MVISVVAGDSNQSTTGQSWQPVDLSDIIAGLQAGALKRPSPTVGRLSDGTHLLYAGRTNGLAGESGCGKSWTALQSVATELEDGKTTVFVDFEDDETGLVARLLAMGVDPLALNRFFYIHPDEAFLTGSQQFDSLLDRVKPTLVVIDSTGESMAIEGCDPNSDDAVARWFQRLPTHVARRGPAVLVIDHLPKSNTGAPSPIGSQRKRAALSGVQFIQEVRKGMSFAMGRAGEALLTCTKDRNGHFVTGEVVAKLIVNPNSSMPDGSGCTVSLAPAVPSAWAPTKHMADISAFMSGAPGALSTTDICAAVSGKKSTLIVALAVLVESGYLTFANGPNGSKLYTFVQLFQNGDPFSLPADHDAGEASSEPMCVEHEWHEGQPCKSDWCHKGHHGRCNRVVGL